MEGNEETNYLMGWSDNVLAAGNSRCAEGCVYKHLECGRSVVNDRDRARGLRGVPQSQPGTIALMPHGWMEEAKMGQDFCRDSRMRAVREQGEQESRGAWTRD